MAKRKIRKARARELEPGFDGAVVVEDSVHISTVRDATRLLRCRPGSFEWRYGRKHDNTALYHAGIHFSELWERAGIAQLTGPDLARVGSSGWRGLPDARAVAISDINEARKELGRWTVSRLVDYCVMGSTASEMAQKYDTDDRGMAHILHQDLRQCAFHFHYL